MSALDRLIAQASTGACYDDAKHEAPDTYCDGRIDAGVLQAAKAELAALREVEHAARLSFTALDGGSPKDWDAARDALRRAFYQLKSVRAAQSKMAS